ncbi:GNAT family N-acetyltransferase [Streptomyces polyrhachis]|uniref:GNAT family N-acetyltransferase n=1 Tax=Streptomyces polyrhachis TaxID=1282885 RepID=A0ABW2GR68_9ACTN
MPERNLLARTDRTAIRRTRREDEARWLEAVRASRELHHPWLRLPDTPEGFQRWMDRFDGSGAAGFTVCAPGSGELLGFVNINNIVHGGFRCGALGYGAFAAGAGRGHLTEGVGLVVRHAFGPLGLHRLEANIQPGNAASIALVRRTGFRLEGFSPDFLHIDGAWRDHERWAITSEMPLGTDATGR